MKESINYNYSDEEKRNIAIAFNIIFSFEYRRFLSEDEDRGMENWKEFLLNDIPDRAADSIDSNFSLANDIQIENIVYWFDNYALFVDKNDSTVLDNAISDFYSYFNDSKLNIDDIVYLLVYKIYEYNEEVLECEDYEELEDVQEMLDELFNDELRDLFGYPHCTDLPNVKFSKSFIKKVLIKAFNNWPSEK